MNHVHIIKKINHILGSFPSSVINEVLKEALSEDAEDLAAFDERANEPLISYEQMVKRLKKDGRL